MKIRIVVCVLFFLTCFKISAQSNFSRYFLHGGISESLMSEDYIEEERLSYEVGIGRLGYINDSFDYLVSVSYSQNPFNYANLIEDGEAIYDQEFSFARINLNGNLNYYFVEPDYGKFNISALLGLTVAYQQIDNVDGFDEETILLSEIEKGFNITPEFGVLLGLQNYRLKVSYSTDIFENVQSGIFSGSSKVNKINYSLYIFF